MTYTTGETSGAAYRDWIAGQTREILRAVSGESWGDAAHPRPANDPRVFIGLPAMPASAYHYASWATDWWWFGRHWLGRW